MPAQSTAVTIRTLDGLHLAGTLTSPGVTPELAVVLAHGGGVTREEGGFLFAWQMVSVRLGWPACASTSAAMARAKAGKRI